jgi:hypothetical protein
MRLFISGFGVRTPGGSPIHSDPKVAFNIYGGYESLRGDRPTFLLQPEFLKQERISPENKDQLIMILLHFYKSAVKSLLTGI